MHEQLNILLAVSGLILIMSLILKRIRQPYIIAYILTGIILGPHGYAVIEDIKKVEALGELGLIILMFFIGMEISLRNFVRNWRVAFFGTGLQVLFSILLIFFIGIFLDWPFPRIILLGFIISLSSSAVVIKLIEDLNLKDSRIGQNVISILLTQDVLIVPMIITMAFISGEKIILSDVLLQISGGVLIFILLVYLLIKKEIRIPFSEKLEKDHELQVFASLIICFGLALLTSFFGLSAGLGAFVAGLLVNAVPSNKWLHESLHSFRVVLISLFFISIGLLIDLQFLKDNLEVILIVLVLVYISNQGVNSISLRFLRNSWKNSLLGGSFLAQIGEFSFVLASIGYQSGIISNYGYQISIIVISLSILISPFWVQLVKLSTKS